MPDGPDGLGAAAHETTPPPRQGYVDARREGGSTDQNLPSMGVLAEVVLLEQRIDEKSGTRRRRRMEKPDCEHEWRTEIDDGVPMQGNGLWRTVTVIKESCVKCGLVVKR